jgi:kumamolisin
MKETAMAKSISHVVLPGSNRPKEAGAVRVGPVDPHETMDLTIALKGPPLPGADETLDSTLSSEQFQAKYGANESDAERVARCLKKFGITVDAISLATRSIRATATAKAVEAAFKANMFKVRSPSQEGVYRGRQGTLKVPTEIRGLVKGVFGIDERRMARRKSKVARKTDAQALSPLSPSNLETRYNFPSGDCAGQRIAVAEFGGGYFAEDTQAYCAKFGRPVPGIEPVAVDAPALTLQQILLLPLDKRKAALGDATEVMLDVEIIAGLCPAATISVYFSTFDEQGWVDLLDAIIEAKPVVLSCSWGLAEEDPGWSSSAQASINDRLNAARLLGITVCVSSGDDGSGDQIADGAAHVDFPGSSPFVLSVGGTMLTSNAGTVDEVVWWDAPGQRTDNGGGSTGGGVSAKFPRPAWQGVKVTSLNRGGIDGRVVPDVAALAGQPLYDLIFAGKEHPNGGTSASAPLWASLVARVDAGLPADKRQRFLTPLLYRAAGNATVGALASRDIVDGNNASFPEPGRGYQAARGFDAVSGWGVPDGKALLAALAAI